MAEVPALESFALSVVSGWSLTQIDCWPDSKSSVDDLLAKSCGMAMPQAVGETVRDGALLAIRIAPRRIWLVDDATAGNSRVADGIGAAVVSLSHGRQRFRLQGRRVREVLARCVALDFDAPTMSPGRAAQTVFHRVPVLLLRQALDAVEIFVPRSFAEAVQEQLDEAARGLG
jgi:sarcosine oxidase subunit gamma